MIDRFKKNVFNIPGYHNNRKVIVFESDDWGSIRMPSKKHYKALIKEGIRVDKSKYDSLDCLENNSDLNKLGDVLSTVKAKNGSKPVFTFNTVMGNPDFQKIKENEFSEFYHEPFFESYKKYYGEDNKDIWHQLIDNKLIRPQFHAREHLNSSLWLKDLQNGYPETLAAFKHNFFGLKTKTSNPHQKHYLSAYHVTSRQDLEEKIKVAKEGLSQFNKVFGFKSDSFIGCNYVWPKELEKPLKDFGVKVLQGQRGHIVPSVKNGTKSVTYHYTGQQNKIGQTYTVRNCLFEPYLDEEIDWVESCLSDIKRSFFWKKPAIISTHRINYVSEMSIEHRDRNLRSLSSLISRIVERWPEVEFMSSDQFGKVLIKK